MSETGPILIIEDDADTRQVFRDVLEARGYSVATAANGREGLDRLAMAPRPCLILVDLMMPVMDGLEFLQRFQTTEHAGRIPVLVVSAYHDMAARAEGADGFVEKPLQLDRLVDLVRDYCGPAD